MTLVARFGFEGRPLLVGDILTSGAFLPGLEFVLPSRASFTPRDGATIAPRGLCQKLVLCGDHIAFGWAGNTKVAAEVVSEIMESSIAKETDPDTFLLRLNDIIGSSWTEIGLTGFFAGGEQILGFGGGVDFVDLPTTTYGAMGVIGSGIKDWNDAVGRFHWEGLGPDPPSVRRSVKAGLTLINSLLNSEVVSSQYLHNHFGGGYELVVRSNDQFIKYQDVTYICWYAKLLTAGRIEIDEHPLRAFRYAYHNDFLIRTHEPSWTDDSFATSIFVVPPIYRDVDTSEVDNIPVPDLNTKAQCICVLLDVGTKRLKSVSMIQFRSDKTPWIQFREGDGYLDTIADKDFYNKILGWVRTWHSV